MKKCFRFSPRKLREKSKHRTLQSSQLRKVFVNLYGIEFLNGSERFSYLDGYGYLFDLYERGFLNDIELIRSLQSAIKQFNFK